MSSANLQSGNVTQSQGNLMYMKISFKLSAEVLQALNGSMVVETAKGVQIGIQTAESEY